MKKIGLVLTVVLVLSMLFTGCTTEPPDLSSDASETSSENVSAAEESEAEVWKVGMTVFDIANPIWASYVKYIEAHQDEYNMEFTIVNADNNSATQVQQVETFVQSGVDAIVIAPTEGEPLNPIVNEALEQGIVVFQHPVYCENYTSGISIDEYENGYMIGMVAAQYINDELGGTAKIGVFSYDIMDSIIPRGDGMKEAIAELAPNVEMVIEATVGTTEDGMSAAENFFQAHPDLDMIVCINDAGAIGAIETAKASGLSTDEFAVVGCDATKEALQYMKDGEYMVGTVSLGGDEAYCEAWLFPGLQKALSGEEVEKDQEWVTVPVYINDWEETAALLGYELE